MKPNSSNLFYISFKKKINQTNEPTIEKFRKMNKLQQTIGGLLNEF